MPDTFVFSYCTTNTFIMQHFSVIKLKRNCMQKYISYPETTARFANRLIRHIEQRVVYDSFIETCFCCRARSLMRHIPFARVRIFVAFLLYRNEVSYKVKRLTIYIVSPFLTLKIQILQILFSLCILLRSSHLHVSSLLLIFLPDNIHPVSLQKCWHPHVH